MSLPWIEKYRPKILADVVGNRPIIELFSVFSKDESMPHLILTGTPGIGKTTIINALLNEFFPDLSLKKEAVLEMNASDERGVDIVRTKIRSFLQKKLKSVRFLILDESDSMTTAAQHSMRRLLEKHQDAKFIFLCNDLEKISDTIQSRCAILRLTPLSKEDLQTIVQRIATAESLTIPKDAIALVAENAEGDARQAINFLQTLATISKSIQLPLVQRMTHIPPIDTVQQMFAPTATRQSSLNDLQALLTNGYTPEDIAKLIFKVAKDKNNLFLLDQAAKLLIKLTNTPSTLHFYALLLNYHQQAHLTQH
ncbi:replication factor C subunit 2/4 [Nematocida homosporus]|uniref:replication factor C subunit 2/4 n=1 Tax=Nematocida homosporus TaxID=1912981 RepID=UPI00221FAAE4|nr:replication factor C subunit 2/4 [Nematocida homosporus]KAI5187345.1 replication factor C subunit 2/4 [Nematocida homosporus]